MLYFNFPYFHPSFPHAILPLKIQQCVFMIVVNILNLTNTEEVKRGLTNSSPQMPFPNNCHYLARVPAPREHYYRAVIYLIDTELTQWETDYSWAFILKENNSNLLKWYLLR